MNKTRDGYRFEGKDWKKFYEMFIEPIVLNNFKDLPKNQYPIFENKDVQIGYFDGQNSLIKANDNGQK